MPPKRRIVPNASATVAPDAATTTTTSTTTSPSASGIDDYFDGCVICFSRSAKLSNDIDHLSKLVQDHGGIAVLSVNNRVTHFVTDSRDDSEMAQNAKKLGLHIVTEDWIIESVKKNSKLTESDYQVKSNVDSDDENDSDTATTTTNGKKRKKPDSAVGDTKSVKKLKVIKKGRGVVDPHCTSLTTACHVLDDSSAVWDAMLNQTNVGANNNKFYKLQLLESDDKKQWYVWTRWGRVGATGQSKLMPFTTKDRAIAEFKKKFTEKTLNRWEDRDSFTPYPGKYTLIAIDYGSDSDATSDCDDSAKEAKKKEKEKEKEPSKLDKRVQELIKLIANIEMMKDTLVEMEFDVNKMPLGKLKKSQIQKGYQVLKEIERELSKGSAPTRARIIEYTNQFYTLIPHNFGMRPPTLIDSIGLLKKKMQMLETLGDIEIATTLLKSKDIGKSPVDAAYETLNAEIVPVDRGSPDFHMILKYVSNTHAPTHTDYELQVDEVFRVRRSGERERYLAKYSTMSNRMLLWHGSRLTNFMGILSQGLRIAPPEAPATGYMFGKGLYFADMSSKSANYCHASRANPYGLLLLTEVALGRMYGKIEAEYMDKPPAGYDSTFGQGKTIPDPSATVTWDDGIQVPLGNPVRSPDPAVSSSKLLYNEFIVYDTAQVNVRFLVKVKFLFK